MRGKSTKKAVSKKATVKPVKKQVGGPSKPGKPKKALPWDAPYQEALRQKKQQEMAREKVKKDQHQRKLRAEVEGIKRQGKEDRARVSVNPNKENTETSFKARVARTVYGNEEEMDRKKKRYQKKK